MKKIPAKPTPKSPEEPDRRQLVRAISHRTTGSRAPIMPHERADQPRKHGQHRGPRPEADTDASP
jgi:hypothetical protein